MADYRELTVWQKSMDLLVLIYKYTGNFPHNEEYGLTSQMRRAAVSIPSNIAEGSRRRGKELSHFLTISFGSSAELETQLEACRRLKYGNENLRLQCGSLLTEVLKMLNKMLHY